MNTQKLSQLQGLMAIADSSDVLQEYWLFLDIAADLLTHWRTPESSRFPESQATCKHPNLPQRGELEEHMDTCQDCGYCSYLYQI